MEKRRVRRIGVLSASRLLALVYALIALIFAVPWALVSLTGFGSDSGMVGLLFGLAAPIVFPVIYGVFGFIITAITVALYNLVAGWVGGIEVTLQVDTPH